MPRAKRNHSPETNPEPYAPRSAASDAEWGGFINIRLTDEQKDAARSWIESEAKSILSWLTDELWVGFKLSVTADVANNCFIATFTGTPYEGSKLRCSLSARGSTWFEAVGLLMYKQVILSERNWGQYRTDGRKQDQFG